MKHFFRYIDANLEKVFITVSYIAMSGIVFVEVIRRFFFGMQAPWSTQIPIYLFLILAWIGASYNAKTRTHLSFSEVRARLSYGARFACQILDYICWVGLAIVVTYYTYEQMIIIMDNYAMVFGTDLYVWYFYTATPIGWLMIIYRVTQNLFADIRCYRKRLPFGANPEGVGI